MIMIEERYCSFKISKLLQEKGFNEPCRSIYIDCGDYIDFYYSKEEQTDLQLGVFEVLRPTHQMAMDWLSEKYDLHIIVYPYKADNEKKWCCYVYKTFNLLGCEKYVNETLNSYKDGVEAALKYCLTKLI